jgi:hypothetical protein
MSKKKKFLSGLAVLILAGGVSAVASVPSNAAKSNSGAARAAQAAPDNSGSERIIVSQRIIVPQRIIVSLRPTNAGVVDYFRAVPTGVSNSNLKNSIVTKEKLAPVVKKKLNKVDQKADHGQAGPTGDDGQKGDNESADPAGPDDQNGDNESADPAGSDDHKGDNESADPAGSDDHKGDTGAESAND